MKFDYLKSVSPLELVLFVVFVLYIVFPIDVPYLVASWMDSTLGMILLFCIGVYLFMHTTPILGVLFIFVAYELIRRTTAVTGRTAIIEYTPTQVKKDVELAKMNPPQERTLEEDMVDLRAPIGRGNVSEYVESSFKPVSDKTVNVGSLI